MGKEKKERIFGFKKMQDEIQVKTTKFGICESKID